MKNQTSNVSAKLTGSELWDKIAVCGDYQNKALRDYMNSQYSSLVSHWLGNVKNKSILKTDMYEEALSGKSILSIFKPHNKIIGTDISKLIIRKIIKNPNLRFITRLKVGDSRDKIFRKAEFDIVLSLSTLDHIPKKDFVKALNVINYELKKDGILILSLNNKHNFHFCIIHKLDSIFRLRFPSYFYSTSETRRFLSESGFKVLKEDYTIFIPPGLTTFLNLAKKANCTKINNCAYWITSKLNLKNKFLKKHFGYYLIVYAKKLESFEKNHKKS